MVGLKTQSSRVELFRWSPRKGIGVNQSGSYGPSSPNADVVWIAPASGRDLQTIQILLQRGANPTAVTPYGLSALHLVSIPGCECSTENSAQDPTCPSLALALIDAGADVNAFNEDEDSVLDLVNCLRLKAELASRGAKQGYREEWIDDREEEPDDDQPS